MRVGLVVLVVSVVFGLGQAASAETLPDLPGMGVATSMTGGAEPSKAATTVEANAASDAGVPAPDPAGSTVDSDAVVADAASPEDAAVVAELPGGTAVPLIADIAPVAATGVGTAMLAALALAVVVVWTRFLFRLNHIR